jgi:hypothetical protein
MSFRIASTLFGAVIAATVGIAITAITAGVAFAIGLYQGMQLNNEKTDETPES